MCNVEVFKAQIRPRAGVAKIKSQQVAVLLAVPLYNRGRRSHLGTLQDGLGLGFIHGKDGNGVVMCG